MKKLLLTFIITISLILPNLAFSGEPDIKLHEKCIYPAVQVINIDTIGSGSGVIIQSKKIKDNLYHNTVLTVAHVLKSVNYEIWVSEYTNWSYYKTRKKYLGRVYGVNSSIDFGIIIFKSRKKMPVADLYFNPKLYLGNEVYKAGFGSNNQAKIEFGKITSININSKPFKNHIRSTAPTVPGDSGGPVFHEYKIIGLARAVTSTKQGNILPHISFITPLSHFLDWVKTDDKLDFILDESKKGPWLPFFFLRLDEETEGLKELMPK